jgi:predicted nucleic acid-binding protein
MDNAAQALTEEEANEILKDFADATKYRHMQRKDWLI